jgi:hypothetical protein
MALSSYVPHAPQVAESLFRSHIAERARAGEHTTSMAVTRVSPYGFVTERRFASAREVALEIVTCLPEGVMGSRGSIADAVVEQGSSCIRITTPPHLAWHLEHDRHPCPACGRFCHGAHGLRTHLVKEHGEGAERVREAYLMQAWQLVVYSPPPTPLLPPSLPTPLPPSAAQGISGVVPPASAPAPGSAPGSAPAPAIEGGPSDSTETATASNTATATTTTPPATTRELDGLALAAAKCGDMEAIVSLMQGTHPCMQRSSSSSSSTTTTTSNSSSNSSSTSSNSTSTSSKTATPRWDIHACSDEEGFTPLTWAAGNGHLSLCRYLVEAGLRPNEVCGRKKRRRQPIHWCARNGHTDICAWLVLEHGVDVDAAAENGTTPLHFAIWKGHMDCVRWLIEIGRCNVNVINAFGCNAANW